MTKNNKNSLVKKIRLSDCYLANRNINIKGQKETPLYKEVLESIKKIGLVNPLIVVKDNGYKVCLGNNRYLACKELNIKYVDVIISENQKPLEIKKFYKFYKKVLKNESPHIK